MKCKDYLRINIFETVISACFVFQNGLNSDERRHIILQIEKHLLQRSHIVPNMLKIVIEFMWNHTHLNAFPSTADT